MSWPCDVGLALRRGEAAAACLVTIWVRAASNRFNAVAGIFGARVFRQMYVHLDCHITIFIKIDLNPEHCSVDAVHVAGLFFGSNPSTSCTNVASAVKCCSAAAPLH